MSVLTPGTVLRNRYRVRRLLGEGGMSEVYLADDTVNGGYYAIKVLKSEMQDQLATRFELEAKLKLRHPNIVCVHGGFHDRGKLMFVLDYIEGESLAQIISRGPFDISTALALFEPILEALDYAHRQGVIHRDVKPSNILIDRAGVPRLCDFGIARQLGERRLTKTGISLGTPLYMSPEQIQTPPKVDFRSDLYSSGIVLYEMLAGRLPFDVDGNGSDFEILRKQVHDDPPDPRKFNDRIDRPLVQILRKALNKEPGLRYQGGMEFKRALVAYRQGTSSDSRPQKFAIYENTGHRTMLALRTGFSWRAFLGGPIWLAKRGVTWAALIVFSAVSVLLQQCFAVNSPVLFILALLAWSLPPGWFGNRWRARLYKRQGYRFIRKVMAVSADQALRR